MAGFGGSNAAIIVEKAPSRRGENGHATNSVKGTNGDGIHATQDETRRLFVFSAKTEKSLTAYLASFDEYLDEAPESSGFARDLGYTLGQRRTHHPYRVAVVADSVESLQEKLSSVKPSRIKERVIAFAFTGQGAQ